VLKGHATTGTTIAATARQLFGTQNPQYLNAITIAASQAIADTGATSIFIMEGTPCKNLRPAIRPLTINLLDGTKVKSTHTCNITIPGLPKVLVGHVVPKLTIASLIGIRVLCDAGCKVFFTKTNCNVWYNGNVILSGKKDPSTDLWTLPINADIKVTKSIDEPTSTPSQAVCPPKREIQNWKITPWIHLTQQTHWRKIRNLKMMPSTYTTLPSDAHNGFAHVASFTHSVKTRANGVKFAHQSLCNPKISTLLKAV
jgi:hypothetical protein